MAIQGSWPCQFSGSPSHVPTGAELFKLSCPFLIVEIDPNMAKPGDIVLILGKGHENYQILKDKTIHFDDREVALESLKNI